MQITIYEKEIKQALEEYIGRLFTVAQGTQMSIELRSTRGDLGNTAIIDILPAARPESPKFEPKTVPSIRTSQTHDSTSATTAVVRNMPAISTGDERVSEEDQGDTSGDTSQGEDAPGMGSPESTGDPVKEMATTAADSQASAMAAASEEAPKQGTGAGRSLFGGLKKPKN